MKWSIYHYTDPFPVSTFCETSVLEEDMEKIYVGLTYTFINF